MPNYPPARRKGPPAIKPLALPHYDSPVEDPTDLRTTCEFIIRAMLIQPDDMVFTWGQRGTRLEMTVSPAPGKSSRQNGALIGKEGGTIMALRKVLQVISLRYGYCVHVIVHDRMLPSPELNSENVGDR